MSGKIKFNKLTRSKKSEVSRRLSPVLSSQSMTVKRKSKPASSEKEPSVTTKTTLKEPDVETTPEEKSVTFDGVTFKDGIFFSNTIQENDQESDDENEYDLYKDIELVKFNFMNEEDVLKFSVVEVTDTRLSGPLPNSLYDLRMGPIDNKETCETCESNCKECPGHFGYIKLNAKIPHPLRSKTILEYLTLFCNKCHRLMMTKEKLFLLGYNKYKGESKYKLIYSFVVNNVKVCPHCETVTPSYSCVDDKYMMEMRDSKIPIRYDDIYEIFSNIRPEDVALLGFDDETVHPIRLMISNLLVVPPCVRPFVKSDDGEHMHDDLTYKYIDIIKTNKKVELEMKEKTKLDEIDRLMFHIRTLMDNNKGKARDIQGKRPLKCIKKRLSGKQGRIRQNIQGKRSDFCARTVIGPEVYCRVDELVVPQEVARTLTYPVTVNKLNIENCKKLLDEGKVNFIIRKDVIKSAKVVLWTQGFKFEQGDIVYRNSRSPTAVRNADTPMAVSSANKIEVFKIDYNGQAYSAYDKKIVLESTDQVYRNNKLIPNAYAQQPRRKKFELKIGDVIERQLQNGDLCVFNRQPTLWKGSMRAKRIKILPGKTFRFSLASTQAFNGD